MLGLEARVGGVAAPEETNAFNLSGVEDEELRSLLLRAHSHPKVNDIIETSESSWPVTQGQLTQGQLVKLINSTTTELGLTKFSDGLIRSFLTGNADIVGSETKTMISPNGRVVRRYDEGDFLALLAFLDTRDKDTRDKMANSIPKTRAIDTLIGETKRKLGPNHPLNSFLRERRPRDSVDVLDGEGLRALEGPSLEQLTWGEIERCLQREQFSVGSFDTLTSQGLQKLEVSLTLPAAEAIGGLVLDGSRGGVEDEISFRHLYRGLELLATYHRKSPNLSPEEVFEQLKKRR